MPALTVIQGPDRGKAFSVDGESAVIGRDDSCEVALSDPSISREHARLEADGDRYVIRDNGSANGTHVNGVRVTDAVIHAGDQIRVGNSVLAVGRSEAGRAWVDHRGMPIRIDTGDQVDVSIMATEDATGEPHLAFAGGEDMAEMRTSVAGLRALYRIADMLAHGYDIDRLLSQVMDMVFDVVDADRGAILLEDEKTGAMVPQAVRYREELIEQIRREQGGADEVQAEALEAEGEQREQIAPICVSRTIINYTLERGEGVLSTNAMQDRRFESGESVQDYGIRSTICVPIRSREEILGILHVDTHMSQGQFTPEDLRLMTAIGLQTGMAVANARLMARQVEQERLAAVGQTVASLSHTIKNILQGIQGGSHAVENGLENDEVPMVKEGWEIVSRNLGRVNQLVLDMLSYSRQAPPNLTQSNVNAIVREVMELVQSTASEKGIKIESRLNTSLPEIQVDPDGLHHAILNIVTNAIDAVPALRGKVEVSTRLSPAEDEVWVVVADNGPGIPEGEKRRVFDAFYSTKGDKGTGLGLAAAAKIIEEQGGRISLRSKPGQGAAFVIRLPRNRKR